MNPFRRNLLVPAIWACLSIAAPPAVAAMPNADINDDGIVNGRDIQPFAAMLFGL